MCRLELLDLYLTFTMASMHMLYLVYAMNTAFSVASMICATDDIILFMIASCALEAVTMTLMVDCSIAARG